MTEFQIRRLKFRPRPRESSHHPLLRSQRKRLIFRTEVIQRRHVQIAAEVTFASYGREACGRSEAEYFSNCFAERWFQK